MGDKKQYNCIKCQDTHKIQGHDESGNTTFETCLECPDNLLSVSDAIKAKKEAYLVNKDSDYEFEKLVEAVNDYYRI